MPLTLGDNIKFGTWSWMENNTKAYFTTAMGVAGEDDLLSDCFFQQFQWWPERESNPRHEDFQWRVANFLIVFQ